MKIREIKEEAISTVKKYELLLEQEKNNSFSIAKKEIWRVLQNKLPESLLQQFEVEIERDENRPTEDCLWGEQSFWVKFKSHKRKALCIFKRTKTVKVVVKNFEDPTILFKVQDGFLDLGFFTELESEICLAKFILILCEYT